MTAFSTLLLALTMLTLSGVQGQIPCDDAYGQFCPSESGFGVADCLKSQDLTAPGSLGDACLSYIALHDTCRGDIDAHCVGKEFTGDLLVCLAEWTKPADLTAACLEALPKKVVEEKKLTKKQEEKAAKRRRTRKAAEKLAREL
jgi:hypothetical protein